MGLNINVEGFEKILVGMRMRYRRREAYFMIKENYVAVGTVDKFVYYNVEKRCKRTGGLDDME